jgi:hypothetical protein
MFLNPTIIYFTHSKIRNRFTGCGKLLLDTYEEIKNNPDLINRIPKIKVIFDPTRQEYFSMNNRRLWVFKKLYEEKIINEVPVILEKMKNNSRIKTNMYSQFAKLAYK